MKKLISLLAVIALVAVFATAAFATEAPALVVDTVETVAGEEVVVNISIVNNPGITLGEFYVRFDTEALELVSMKAVGGEGWLWDAKCNKTAMKFAFMAEAEDPETGDAMEGYTLTGDAVLLTLTLKVKENVKPGTYEIVADVDGNSFIGDETNDLIVGVKFSGAVVVGCTEHEWDEGTVKTPATCTEAGVMEYKCIYCGATKEEPIAAIGHAWGEWTVTTPAGCGTAGEETRTCANCGEVETREIPAGEHAWGEWTVVTEATCCTDGLKTRTCANCSATEEEVIAANGEHTWNEGEVKTEATCCEDGLKVYTCVNGTATKEEVIPATGAHELGYTDNKDGKTHTVYCKNSDKVLDPAEVHTFVEGVCICGAVEVVPPTGDNSVIAVAFATLSMLGITAVVSKKKEF